MPAPNGNKHAVGNKGGGRKTSYKPEFTVMAKKLAMLGLTDAEMAGVFEVTEKTFNTWKKKFIEFSTALKKGKAIADAQVAKKLFERATGYEHKAVKFFQFEGQVITQEYTERYPPDTTAAIFWLKNRQADKWRDKQVTGVEFEKLTDEQLDLIVNKLINQNG